MQFCSGVCGCASNLLLLLKGNVYAGLGVERSGFETGLGHCLVFLRKTPYSYSASLHPRVEMGTRELSGKPDNMPRGNFAFSRYPMLHPKETGMSSCWVSHIALVQTLTYYERKPLAIHVISALSLLRYWIHSVIYSLL